MDLVVSAYTPQIESFTNTLLTRIRSSEGESLNVNSLALHYSYDVAMQLAFGQAGGFISGSQSATARSVMAGIKEATFALGLLYHVPWIMTLLTTFAFLPGPMKVWNDWSEKMLNERKQVSEAVLKCHWSRKMFQNCKHTKTDEQSNSEEQRSPISWDT